MTDAQIAASGAPTWEKTIMTAMAHYGMYVNDTDGIDNVELEAESDISYTSLGGQPLMSNFMKASGGYYYAPLSRWILGGHYIPLTKLRAISPCFAQGTCPGSAAPALQAPARRSPGSPASATSPDAVTGPSPSCASPAAERPGDQRRDAGAARVSSTTASSRVA